MAKAIKRTRSKLSSHVGIHKAGWVKRAGVAVHTGSRVGNNPLFSEKAAELGQALVVNGFRNIWYGDGDAGTMGLVAQSAIRAGGNVYGVSLDFFHAAQGEGLPGAKASIAVPTMHERMHIMRNGIKGVHGAAVNVANFGSYGTMEEQWEWLISSNGILKPQIWNNFKGHWDGDVEFLKRMVKDGFEKPSLLDRFSVVSDVDGVIKELKRLNRSRAKIDCYDISDVDDADYITETRHALIVKPAPLKPLSHLMSRIVTYDVSNIEGQTVFTDPEGIIKPAIFVGDYYEFLQEQLYHIIGTGFSPEERRQFFHFVETEAEAIELAADLDAKEPLRPENLKKKHQEGLSRADQQLTHPALDSLLPDSPA